MAGGTFTNGAATAGAAEPVIVAGHNAGISAGGAAANHGTLEAGNILQVQAGSLNNDGGALRSAGDLVITAGAGGSGSGAVSNANGTIQAGRNLNLAGGDFSGPGGTVQSGWDAVISAGTLDNQAGGTLQGDLGVALQATNAAFAQGSTIEGYAGPVQIVVGGALTNQGTITTHQDLALQAGSATATAAAVGLAGIVGGFVVTTDIGFAAGFVGTLIGTGGDLGQAFQSGLIGFAVAGVTFGVLHLPAIQDAVNGNKGGVRS